MAIDIDNELLSSQISGLGETYSFLDMRIYEEDPLRLEFGSFWTDPWTVDLDRSPGAEFLITEATSFLSHAIFGNSAADPRFEIEFGPIAATTRESAPYVAHHQQVKLTAKTSIYGFINPDLAEGEPVEAGTLYVRDCLDCGFHADAEASLGGHPDMLALTPTEALNYYFNYYAAGYQYSSMLDPGEEHTGGSLTYRNCFHDLMTPYNEEDVRLANESVDTGDLASLTANGSTSFEYGDFVERLEEVILNLDEKDIPNFYMLLFKMDSTELMNASWDYLMATEAGTPEYDKFGNLVAPAMPTPEEFASAEFADAGVPITELESWTNAQLFFNQVVEYLQGKLDCNVANIIESIGTGYTDFIVSADNVKALKGLDIYKEYFSLRAETEFSTTTFAPIADSLKSFALDCRLLRWITEKRANADLVSTGVSFQKLDQNSLKNVLSDGALDIRTFDLFKWLGTNGEDLSAITAGTAPASTLGFIGPGDLSTSMASGLGLDATTQYTQADLGHLSLADILKGGLLASNLSFQDVFNGKAPYSETLAYKISKYKKADISSGWGTLFSTSDQLGIVQSIIKDDIQSVQNVWLANSSEDDAISYVDSQMKYDEGYVFVIWAYTLVLGTKHFYSNFKTSLTPWWAGTLGAEYIPSHTAPDTERYLRAVHSNPTLSDQGWSILDDDIRLPDTSPSDFYVLNTTDSFENGDMGPEDDCEVTFTATTLPMAVIKEVPFFVWPGSIMDKPPTIPDVNIVPYCGIDNKLLIMLNKSAGTLFMEPIIINEDEQIIFDNIKESQDTATSSNIDTDIIEFGSDNPSENYEIYRTTELPSSYSDFAGNLLITLSTVFNKTTSQKSDSTSYVDNIEPNTKYYYIFRSIDIHGHFSNPSPVFEVEMTNDQGIVTSSIRVIEMEEKSNKDATKASKSTLHIVPRITQAVVNEEASGITGETADVQSSSSKPVLGVEEDSPWGKTFKIRLTSKNTRRKIDFNVTFDTDHVTVDQNLPTRCPDDGGTAGGTVSATQEYLTGLAGARGGGGGGMGGGSIGGAEGSGPY